MCKTRFDSLGMILNDFLQKKNVNGTRYPIPPSWQMPLQITFFWNPSLIEYGDSDDNVNDDDDSSNAAFLGIGTQHHPGLTLMGSY